MLLMYLVYFDSRFFLFDSVLVMSLCASFCDLFMCYYLKFNSGGAVQVCRGISLILIYGAFSELNFFFLTSSVLIPRFRFCTYFYLYIHLCIYTETDHSLKKKKIKMLLSNFRS